MKKPGSMFVITVMGTIVVGLIFVLYVVSSLRSIRTMRASLEEMERQRITVSEKKETEPGTKENTVPKKIWGAEFIESVYHAAKKFGISDLAIGQKTDHGQTGSQRSSMPQGRQGKTIRMDTVKISFHAGYRNMAEFVREIQGFDKPVSIDSLRIKRDKGLLNVEMTVNLYSMGGK